VGIPGKRESILESVDHWALHPPIACHVDKTGSVPGEAVVNCSDGDLPDPAGAKDIGNIVRPNNR